MFSHEARRIFGHGVVSMFIGTIPMGLATIINGFVVFGLPLFAITIASGLWGSTWRCRSPAASSFPI